MQKYFFFFFTSLLFPFLLSGQPFPEQDCINAIPIVQNSITVPDPYVGQGSFFNEINGNISCLSTGEKNGAWYSYCVKTSGNLCFSIVPVNETDDYDFAVFNLTSHSCSEIFYDTSLEISCNYMPTLGITGANGLPGSQNNSCIAVFAGEKYAIYVT